MAKREMFNATSGPNTSKKVSGKGVKYFKDSQKGFDIASRIETKEVKPRGFDGEFRADMPLSIKEVGNKEANAAKMKED